MEELQRHVTETEEKLLREAEGHGGQVAVVQASTKVRHTHLTQVRSVSLLTDQWSHICGVPQVFEAVKRGRDRELSWLTVMLDKVLGSEDTIAAIKRLCAEVKEQIKMFQASTLHAVLLASSSIGS